MANSARNQSYGKDLPLKRRVPRNLTEQLTLKEAQAGAGKSIIENLGDPRYKGWHKYEHTHRAADGTKTTVHYLRNPKTGFRTDFKFK